MCFDFSRCFKLCLKVLTNCADTGHNWSVITVIISWVEVLIVGSCVWCHRSGGWAAESEDHQCPGYSCPCWSCYTLWYWIIRLSPQAALEGYQTAQRKGNKCILTSSHSSFMQDQHPALSLHVAVVWIFTCYKVSLKELLLSVKVRRKTVNTLLVASDKYMYYSGPQASIWVQLFSQCICRPLSPGSGCLPQSYWLPDPTHGCWVCKLLHQGGDADPHQRVPVPWWGNEKDCTQGKRWEDYLMS